MEYISRKKLIKAKILMTIKYFNKNIWNLKISVFFNSFVFSLKLIKINIIKIVPFTLHELKNIFNQVFPKNEK